HAESNLVVNRLLAPQSSVIIKAGNPFRYGDKIRTAVLRGSCYEVDDRFFDGAIIPAWKRVGNCCSWRGRCIALCICLLLAFLTASCFQEYQTNNDCKN